MLIKGVKGFAKYKTGPRLEANNRLFRGISWQPSTWLAAHSLTDASLVFDV